MDEMIDYVFPSVGAKKTRIDLLFISHFHADYINGIKVLLKKCHVQRMLMPKLTDEIFFGSMLYSCSDSGYAVSNVYQMLDNIK